MSTAVAYDPALFLLERAATLSARLGEFVLGLSRLGGASTAAWVTVPAATFTWSEDYQPDQNGTLIYGSETASVALSFWHRPATSPLYPGDRVRATYDGHALFEGRVDTTLWTYATDPEAVKHQSTRRVDFTATLVGAYAGCLSTQVCWVQLPGETAYQRVSRFVTVLGWPGS